MSMKFPNVCRPRSMNDLLEFEETEDHSNQTANRTTVSTTNTTTTQQHQVIPSSSQLRPVTPTKGLTVSPMSSNPDLLALVGTPHSVPLPLPLSAPLVEEGWQEYVEYERSQHSSPTNPTGYTAGSQRQGHDKTPPHAAGNEELFSPATVYNDESEEEEEDVWNDVDSISSRRNSICSQSNQADVLPPRGTRPPLPPSQSMRIPVPVVVSETEPIDSVMTFSGSVDFEGESYMYNNSNANPARIRTILCPPSQDVLDIDRDIGVDVEAHSGVTDRVADGVERGVAEGPDGEEGDDCEDLWHEVASVSGHEDGEGDLVLFIEEEATTEPGELSPLTSGGDSVYSVDITAASATAVPAAQAGAAAVESVLVQTSRTRSLAAPSLREKKVIIATAYAQLGMFAVFASMLVVLVSCIVSFVFASSARVPLILLAQLVVLLGLLRSFV